MIECLYDCFKHWAANGSVYIMSDTHFEDADCLLMDPNLISPEKQIEILNAKIHKNDTLILLGDIGNPDWAKKIKGKKILVTGNHDVVHLYKNVFDEIYDGPLFIAPKILLSHEPIFGLNFCVNIHGHDHSGGMRYFDNMGCKHINVAENICGYTPINLKEEIKNGLISKTDDIHRLAINHAAAKLADRK